MATLFEYSRQAETYDLTRAASPSVLEPLAAALGTPGVLVDVGGGTGNYAVALRERGWRPTLVDHSAAMSRRARAKGLPVAVGDAAALPLPTGRADAVMLVSMLHHVPDWRGALAEARRAVRPGGRVVVMAFHREHIGVHWMLRRLPTVVGHFGPLHQTRAELLAELPGATVAPLYYDDVVDGSVAALCRRPELLLDPEVVRQTSLFEWAGDHAAEELRVGLDRLADELAAGLRPQDDVAEVRAELGDAALFAWERP